MKKGKTVIALSLVASMLFSLTACSSGVKEYNKDSLMDVLKSELKLDDDEIFVHESEDDATSRYEGTVVTARYEDARINAVFLNDAEDAADAFEEYYDDFDDNFNSHDQFNGDYAIHSADGSGYIVINGKDSEVHFFGDRYANGPLHAGLYYSGSMIVFILPENDDGMEDVGKIISALGFKDVAG